MRPYSVEFLLIISPICFALLWNEFFSYFYYSLRWPKPRYEDSTKILLIADPQLLGYQNEPFGVGLFTLWDSDRFVSKGFEWASNHASPNHVIFLGDLFDEGVSSTEDEYDKTLYRFYNIFTEQSLKEKTVIYIPGDNDIGGEGEPVLPHLKNRFSRTFMNKFTNFSLGYCFSEINMFDFDHSAHFLNKNNCTIHILLSHVPIIQFYNHPNVRAMNPSIILSAHDHSAIVHNLTSTGVISTRLNYLQSFYYTKLLNHTGMLEIQVPTCSYRMGTFETGVSHIELRKSINGSIELYFDVFWLPCRFYHLALYVVSIVLTSILSVFHRRYCRLRRKLFREFYTT